MANFQQCPNDKEILEQTSQTLFTWAQNGPGFAFLETAGGTLSPGPNGSLQADLYRPLRLPVILVADPRLGGISASLAAYETLSSRGYDVYGIALLRDEYYKNHEYLDEFFHKRNIPVISLPTPPEPPKGLPSAEIDAADALAMKAYYKSAVESSNVKQLIESLYKQHEQRIDRLESMADRANDIIWYPFTQHQLVSPGDITVTDSAYDDCFQTFTKGNGSSKVEGSQLLQFSFDGSASWWTQGLGHGNSELTQAAAYAAGRYGHVMFPGAIHEPALSLAETLINLLENPRLRRVFYSDNGSTGMEVAVKMALRAACSRYNWDTNRGNIGIIGLKGSYHGDTIGVMDCSEPSTFNERVEWYRGRGHWFDFPQVKLSRGSWIVDVPEDSKGVFGESIKFDSLSSVFDLKQRKQSETGRRYKAYIKSTIENLVKHDGRRFGAVIIEPIVLGAGGMLFW